MAYIERPATLGALGCSGCPRVGVGCLSCPLAERSRTGLSGTIWKVAQIQASYAPNEYEAIIKEIKEGWIWNEETGKTRPVTWFSDAWGPPPSPGDKWNPPADVSDIAMSLSFPGESPAGPVGSDPVTGMPIWSWDEAALTPAPADDASPEEIRSVFEGIGGMLREAGGAVRQAGEVWRPPEERRAEARARIEARGRGGIGWLGWLGLGLAGLAVGGGIAYAARGRPAPAPTSNPRHRRRRWR